MTRIESEAEALIALGREAMAPSAAERVRVRSALHSALSAAPLGAAPPVAIPKLGAAKIWTTHALTAALLVGIGGVGYWAGYRAGRDAGRVPQPSPALSVAPVASATASVSDPAVSSAAPTALSAPARSVSAVRRAEASAAPVVADVPIDEELRTLRRAEHALRQGNPRLALVLLEDLNRTTQGGRLLEERAAELVVARCALEPSEAVRLRTEFEQGHASSVYLNRVEQSCK